MGQVFNDGIYVVWAEKITELKPGDIIHLTTSTLEYDCMCGCFMNELHRCAKVKVEILNEDLSEYVPEKSETGGCYGYAAAKVVEVIEVGY